MNVINRNVGDLVPYEKNAKKHDKTQIDNVAESIRQYGFVQPIVIDKNDVVVIGHCRLLAAKQLGMQEVPCVCVDELTDEQVRALRIVDNKSNESLWDFDFLSDELLDLDLSGFDFDFGIGDGWDGDSFIDEMVNSDPIRDDMRPIRSYNFNVTLFFPREKYDSVFPYVRDNKDEIIKRIIKEAEENA